jgi:hypothetical protein
LLESVTLQAMGTYEEKRKSGSNFLLFMSKDRIEAKEANVKFYTTAYTLNTQKIEPPPHDGTRDTERDDKQLIATFFLPYSFVWSL